MSQSSIPQYLQDIITQMGGNKALFMMGLLNKARKYSIVYSEADRSVILKPSRALCQFVEIKVVNDLYDIKFFSLKRQSCERVIKSQFEGIYCDQLKEIIEQGTGLSLSLPRFA